MCLWGREIFFFWERKKKIFIGGGGPQGEKSNGGFSPLVISK
ncbi:hypothetical protein EBI_27220 [Enterocytozoon bieneusi H348]|nr:hypothetical protein EBI_27220 [Enterocytozoon bieneusi H348]|eukprot:XP_002651823.1 hypothetical protein EBI_27220 [Enterocytozoon bieneusi H348]